MKKDKHIDHQIIVDEIIEMAWCDKTSFDSMRAQTGLSEAEVIQIMRQSLKPGSFRNWRKRVSGRMAKYESYHQHANMSGQDQGEIS